MITPRAFVVLIMFIIVFLYAKYSIELGIVQLGMLAFITPAGFFLLALLALLFSLVWNPRRRDYSYDANARELSRWELIGRMFRRK